MRPYFAGKRLAAAFPLFALAVLPGAIVAAKIARPGTDYSAFQRKLSKDDQILQAANRLTFGPKPGDVEAVRKMGVKKWIDLQLHPERIAENPEVAQKLAPLESLRLSQADTERNYPNPQMIRAIAAGRQPMPDDPVTRAAVERLVSASGEERRADNEAAGSGHAAESVADRRADSHAAHGNRSIRSATCIAAIPENEVDDVAIALPPGLRFQLMPAAEPALRRKLMLLNAPQQLVAYDLSEGKLYRAILSNRQLQEELVDFWYNHFNVFLDKGADRFLVPTL